MWLEVAFGAAVSYIWFPLSTLPIFQLPTLASRNKLCTMWQHKKPFYCLGEVEEIYVDEGDIVSKEESKKK